MLIGIDGNEANIENRVGVNQYAYELLWALSKLKTEHSFTVYLSNEPRADLPKQDSHWKYKVIPGGGMWILRSLIPYVYGTKNKPDVFFSPSHYSPPIFPIKRACTITDLGYLASHSQFKAYDYWQLRLWTMLSLAICKKVLAISEATKKDIAKHYGYAKNKITTVLLAYDSTQFNRNVKNSATEKVKRKYKIGGKYVLFLSTLKPSKNIEGLLTAWSQIHSDFSDYKLVVTGKKGWLFESIFEKVKELKLEDSVIFTGFIDEEEKAPLMAGAKLFVLPSFWEGFGLDILNAYGCGVPAVVSDRGSIPEVAGKAGLYIDPDRPEEIAKAVKKVLLMGNKEYNKLSSECQAQAKKFSWEKTAKETLSVLENI